VQFAPAANRDSTDRGSWSRSDVNSGRSTREHHIEDTALKTNLEHRRKSLAASLRDLAGLIVITYRQ